MFSLERLWSGWSVGLNDFSSHWSAIIYLYFRLFAQKSAGLRLPLIVLNLKCLLMKYPGLLLLLGWPKCAANKNKFIRNELEMRKTIVICNLF